ncbi:MAG: Lrp/AsnC family transcriptional regulator [Firmicutes bacterium]|nr:Lrp/AsnC family transcriptional regulator [Bacillota bacterium]
MKKDILEILENDSRKTVEEIALMLGKPEQEVASAIAEMEADKVICGYSTLINWESVKDDIVTAMIEVKVTPKRDMGFEHIARRIYGFSEVKSVFLMSGGYDILVMIEGKNLRDISTFVSSKLSTLDSVLSTATHFVLKRYKEHGVIFEKNNADDERMIVSP